MKNKKLLVIGFALALGVFLRGSHVFAATATWDGGGADNNFSTAANWSGDAVPQDGDVLEFPAAVAPTDYAESLTDDIPNLSVAGINISGDSGTATCSNYKYYTLTGSVSLTLTGPINNTATGDCWGSFSLYTNVVLGANVSIDESGSPIYIMLGDYAATNTLNMGSYSLTNNSADAIGIVSNISGSGDIISPTGIFLSGDNSGYSGTITVSAGILSAGSANSLGTAPLTVGNGSTLYLSAGTGNYSIANDITLSGSGISSDPNGVKISFGGGQGGCGDVSTITMTGSVSISNDIVVSGNCNDTLNITNPNLNGHKITLLAGSSATLTVGSQTQTPTYADFTITDNLPNQTLSIGQYQRYFLNGVRGNVTVYSKGILSGTGTAGAIEVQAGGILAPGMSPGCLTSGNLTIDGGTYRAEVGGTEACTGYDQMKVTGTVTLSNNPILEATHYNKYKPAVNSNYIIISNDGVDAVAGTFKDLAEGATFKVDGYVYRISYKGGDGNDVSLSVVSVPSIPDTGIAFIKNNPIATLIGASVAAGSIVLMSRKMKPAVKKARR